MVAAKSAKITLLLAEIKPGVSAFAGRDRQYRGAVCPPPVGVHAIIRFRLSIGVRRRVDRH
jgi:hypothetical protein